MKTIITVKFSNGTEFEMEADECNFDIKQQCDPVYDAGGLVEYRLGDKTMTLTATERYQEKTVPVEPAKLKKVEAGKEIKCPECRGMIAHVVDCSRSKKPKPKMGIPKKEPEKVYKCPHCSRPEKDHPTKGCDWVLGRRGWRQLGVYDG